MGVVMCACMMWRSVCMQGCVCVRVCACVCVCVCVSKGVNTHT